jgi:hypothetical protein
VEPRPLIDEVLVGVKTEGTDPRQEPLRTVRQGKEALSFDGEVEDAPRRRETPLTRVRADVPHLHAEADLHRVDAADVGAWPDGGAERLREELRERGALAAVARRVRVRDVVADDVDVLLARAEARQAGVKTGSHGS